MTEKEFEDRVNRFAKWRQIFASWQIGTRAATDPECQAVRDHREATILLRAEVNALTQLLDKAGVFTRAEFMEQMCIECDILERVYEKNFPGFKSADYGMVGTMPEAAETMKKFPP